MKPHNLILLCVSCSLLSCVLFQTGQVLFRDHRVVWQYDKAHYNAVLEQRRRAEEARKRAAWHKRRHIKDGQSFLSTNAANGEITVEAYGWNPLVVGNARTGLVTNSNWPQFMLYTNLTWYGFSTGLTNSYSIGLSIGQPDSLPPFTKESLEFGWRPDGTIVWRTPPEAHTENYWTRAWANAKQVAHNYNTNWF